MGNGVTVYGGSGLASSLAKYSQSFSATAGQTVFNLTNNVSSVGFLFVDGAEAFYLVATITYTGAKQITFATGFGLGQNIVVYYK